MCTQKDDYSFQHILRFIVSIGIFHLVVDLIDGHSTRYAQHKLQQFYVRHFIAPPIDIHTDDIRIGLLNIRYFSALFISAVLRSLYALVLWLLVDRHIGFEKLTCYLVQAMAIIALVYHGLQLLDDGLGIQNDHESVVVQFLFFAVIWFALTSCRDGGTQSQIFMNFTKFFLVVEIANVVNRSFLWVLVEAEMSKFQEALEYFCAVSFLEQSEVSLLGVMVFEDFHTKAIRLQDWGGFALVLVDLCLCFGKECLEK